MKFKETKSQDRLINLMLQAGVEWPDGAVFAAQDKKHMKVYFYNEKPYRDFGYDKWDCISHLGVVGCSVKLSELCKNWHQTIITREQYTARDGWITWHGGECPVDGFDFEATRADGVVIGGDKVTYWGNEEGAANIIAYRPNKPAQQPEVCESVAACIPDQPTIEQLIAEWKQQREVARSYTRHLEQARELERAEIEKADAAEKRVQDKLDELGWASAQPDYGGLQVTEVNNLMIGDIVEFFGFYPSLRVQPEQGDTGVVSRFIDDGGVFVDFYRYKNKGRDDGMVYFNSMGNIKFIRRPQ